MSDNVIILNNCSVGLRSWCNTYCLQPYTALFVFVFMAATLHSSFFKGFYYNLFPSIFLNLQYSVNLFMYYIAIIIISLKMGKRLGVNWLNACTAPEKFRSIAHSPEEKELTEGDPVLRASTAEPIETITIL